MDYLPVFLSSSVVAGLVAALISLRTSERRLQIENITKERAKWRKAMRDLADAIIKSATAKDSSQVHSLSGQLSLNLNPFDDEDTQLIRVARSLEGKDDISESIQEFVDRMSILLKHDWDRAKREAKPWFFRGSEPRRVPYNEFRLNMKSSPSAQTTSQRNLTLIGYVAMLMISAAILFFLAAGLVEPFKKLALYFNDPRTEKPVAGWLQFLLMSGLVGSVWVWAHLWFKGCEKKFLEVWFSK